MSAALLETERLAIRFGGLLALNDFSFAVRPGTIHALVGPNGAGKSTVFNCISGFYPHYTGEVRFEGKSMRGVPAHDVVRKGIARTFQHVNLLQQLTVLDNILVGMSSRVRRYFPFAPGFGRRETEAAIVREADEVLDLLGLAPLRDVLAGELDFGHQKKLDLARAIASRPRLLLLDEPAAGLRNREIAQLDALLTDLARKRGVTIVLVEHVMQLVMAIADEITVLSFGQKLAHGSPAEIRSNDEVIEAYLGGGAHA